MNANIESLQTIPYQIINDKALANQDYLFKLIIIGDTGKSPSLSSSCLSLTVSL